MKHGAKPATNGKVKGDSGRRVGLGRLDAGQAHGVSPPRRKAGAMERLIPAGVGERIERGTRHHGIKFDPSDLLSCDDSILAAYNHQQRVRVRSDWGERTGRVSTTTGWCPVFILMTRSNAHGSSDVLGPNDHVVATWNGRRYV